MRLIFHQQKMNTQQKGRKRVKRSLDNGVYHTYYAMVAKYARAHGENCR